SRCPKIRMGLALPLPCRRATTFFLRAEGPITWMSASGNPAARSRCATASAAGVERTPRSVVSSSVRSRDISRASGRWPLAYGALFIPTIYFRVALFMIERNSMMRDRVDWPTVRAEADQLLRDARHTRDTYPAIRLVLRRLGDNHSHLVPPETVRAIQHGSNL